MILDPFRFASPAGAGPPTTSVLLWLEADRITGLADGGAVTTWPDASDNATGAAPGSGGGTATWDDGVANGHPVVTLDGQCMNVAYASALSKPATILAVLRDQTSPNTDRTFYDGLTSGARFALAVADSFGTPVWQLIEGSTNVFNAGSTWGKLGTTFHAYRGDHTSGTSTAYVDGVSFLSGSNGGPHDNVGGVRINGRYNQTQFPTAQWAAFVVLEDPSAADLAEWEDYLAAKYAVTF